MTEKNETAASAAVAAAPAAADTNAVVKPQEPVMPDPVPPPPSGDAARHAELVAGGLTDQQALDHIRDEKAQLAEERRVKGDPTEGEIVDLRESALEDADRALGEATAARTAIGTQNQRQRVVTLGETVYYGDGSGAVWPATVVHVYDPSVTDAGSNITGSAGYPRVDLQVFKRKHITDVENVEFHHFDPPRSLNGWIFKA